MDKGLVFFCGIIVIVVALFIPMSVLQDSASVRLVRAKKAPGKSCGEFQAPWAPVGEFIGCESPRNNGKWVCKFKCPPGMTKEPHRRRVKIRCERGVWTQYPRDIVHPRCVARRTVSMVEQNFRPRNMKLVNSLLNNYLNNSYNYLAMAYFCDRADVQLPGFHALFLSLWETSTSMAREVMTYTNRRGGWIDMEALPVPTMREQMHQGLERNHVGLVAMETALSMEQQSQALVRDIMDAVGVYRKYSDPHLTHVLEDIHLAYKVKVVKRLADYVTQLRAFRESGEEYSLGEYQVDISLQ